MYALLRETLKKSGKAGIARVVIQTKQHLAALVADGPVLMLDLLRWSADIRDFDGLGIPSESAKAVRISPQERTMAQQLVESMSGPFKPKQFTDKFRSQVHGAGGDARPRPARRRRWWSPRRRPPRTARTSLT